MPQEEARAELERVAGTQLDPELVRVLIKLMDNGSIAPKKSSAPTDAHVRV
jgi:HD-GYP domain-containing protein (c-di-GMP phosphodiesterase class II)